MKVSSEFVTKEISLVAFMELNQVRPVEYLVTPKGTKKMASFKFNKDETFVKLKEDYFDGKALVEPMSYMDAIRRIKTKINNMEV